MRGRPATMRNRVQTYMQQLGQERVTIGDICRALHLDCRNHHASVHRALMAIGALPVGTTSPRPTPGQRGGCKPAYLWRLP
jgi:hypothetical protein